jgi:hypothetical protein
MSFLEKMENRKVKQVFGGWHQWEGRECMVMVCEGEYDDNVMYSYMKMEK